MGEQVGATHAINELLLQSFEGFLRFFPGWPLSERASFTTLRAVGGFLVSASVDIGGLVSSIELTSEAGRVCTFLNPWIDSTPHVLGPNGAVRMVGHGNGKWSFGTIANSKYTISAEAFVSVFV